MTHAARLLLLVLTTLLASCASKKAAPAPATTVRLAVLNGVIAYEVPPEGEVIDKGWLFSNRQSYRSSNVGMQLSELLGTEFGRIPGVDVWPREDFNIYMAQKERVLRNSHPGLTPVQRKALLDRQDPLDYGRSLGVDYVLSPEVHYASTVANRFFGWWYSTLDTTLKLYDVSTGEIVWQTRWEDTDNFDSQLALMEECARETARAARRAGAFTNR